MSKYLKNTKNLKIYWSIPPKHGFSTTTMKHSGFNIIILENRSLLEGDDEASVTQIYSYQEPQQKSNVTSAALGFDDKAESEYRQKHFVRTLFAYLIMLFVMTFNGWIFLIAVLGLTLGYSLKQAEYDF